MDEKFTLAMPGPVVSFHLKLSLGNGIDLEVVPEDITSLLTVLNERTRTGTFTLRLRKPFIGSGRFDGVKTEHILVDIEARTVGFSLITDTPRQFTFRRSDVIAYLRECNKLIKKEME